MYWHPSGIFHIKLHKAPLITPFSRLLRGVSLGFCAEGVLGGVTRRDLLRESGTLQSQTPIANFRWHG